MPGWTMYSHGHHFSLLRDATETQQGRLEEGIRTLQLGCHSLDVVATTAVSTDLQRRCEAGDSSRQGVTKRNRLPENKPSPIDA